MCDNSRMPPTWPQLEHAIKRNFSGLKDESLDPLKEFEKNLPKNVAFPLDIPPEIQMMQVHVDSYTHVICYC